MHAPSIRVLMPNTFWHCRSIQPHKNTTQQRLSSSISSWALACKPYRVSKASAWPSPRRSAISIRRHFLLLFSWRDTSHLREKTLQLSATTRLDQTSSELWVFRYSADASLPIEIVKARLLWQSLMRRWCEIFFQTLTQSDKDFACCRGSHLRGKSSV